MAEATTEFSNSPSALFTTVSILVRIAWIKKGTAEMVTYFSPSRNSWTQLNGLKRAMRPSRCAHYADESIFSCPSRAI